MSKRIIMQGTVFQTATFFLSLTPRLRPGLLSLRSVLASSQIYTNHQPITDNHQPTTINRQPSTDNHQPTTYNLNANFALMSRELLPMYALKEPGSDFH